MGREDPGSGKGGGSARVAGYERAIHGAVVGTAVQRVAQPAAAVAGRPRSARERARSMSARSAHSPTKEWVGASRTRSTRGVPAAVGTVAAPVSPTDPRAPLATRTPRRAAGACASVVVVIAEDMRIPCGQSGGAAVEGVGPARGAPQVARVTAEGRRSAPRPGPDVAGRRGPRLRASRGRRELRRGRSSELALASRSCGRREPRRGRSPGSALASRWQARPEGRSIGLPPQALRGETGWRAPPSGKVTDRASVKFEPPGADAHGRGSSGSRPRSGRVQRREPGDPRGVRPLP